MRTPSLLADFIHARDCKPFCEKLLTLPLFRFLYRLRFRRSRACALFAQGFQLRDTFSIVTQQVARAAQQVGAAGLKHRHGIFLLLVCPVERPKPCRNGRVVFFGFGQPDLNDFCASLMLISNESPPCTTVVFGVWGWVMQLGEWEGRKKDLKSPHNTRRKREAFGSVI